VPGQSPSTRDVVKSVYSRGSYGRAIEQGRICPQFSGWLYRAKDGANAGPHDSHKVRKPGAPDSRLLIYV